MGLEPILCHHKQILSLPRLPFRHAGLLPRFSAGKINLIIPRSHLQGFFDTGNAVRNFRQARSARKATPAFGQKAPGLQREPDFAARRIRLIGHFCRLVSFLWYFHYNSFFIRRHGFLRLWDGILRQKQTGRRITASGSDKSRTRQRWQNNPSVSPPCGSAARCRPPLIKAPRCAASHYNYSPWNIRAPPRRE